jgi:hypothetical protein
MIMSAPTTQVDSDLYAKFVAAISLVRIRLSDCEIKTQEAMLHPSETNTEIVQTNSRDMSLFESNRSIFFKQKTDLLFIKKTNQNQLAKISVSYELQYQIDPDYIITNQFELFVNTFELYNLPLNAWSFLREFVHNMMGRMNYPILTLPLFQPQLDTTEQ